MDTKQQLEFNLRSIREKVAAAAARAGRHPDSIHMLAVTKSVGPEIVEALGACGIVDVGENRVQDLVAKHNLLGSRFRWHLIGNLQKNKARKALQVSEAIHAIDSLPLLDELGRISSQLSKRTKLFIEINVSGEKSKHGIVPSQASTLLLRAKSFPQLPIVGLMTMAPKSDDPELSRPHFRRLRELRDELAGMGAFEGPGQLSMGMSQDFEIAVEEGADWLRVGSALFQGIDLGLDRGAGNEGAQEPS